MLACQSSMLKLVSMMRKRRRRRDPIKQAKAQCRKVAVPPVRKLGTLFKQVRFEPSRFAAALKLLEYQGF
jgi:hypothetical protein